MRWCMTIGGVNILPVLVMNDSQLDHLLKSCGSCHAPRDFHSEVWNRIASKSAAEGWFPSWKRLVTMAFAHMTRPTGALATCVAFAIIGSLVGFALRPEVQSPEVRYIQTISPFIHQATP